MEKTDKKRRRPFPLPRVDTSQNNTAVQPPEGTAVGPQSFLTLGIRDIEWNPLVPAADMERSMDQCYHALCDLANALRIAPEDISLGGSLSLAFGTRRHKGTGAVYEPEQRKILIARENSAGFLAHAWAHALDAYFGQMYSPGHTAPGTFVSGFPMNASVPESVRNLLHTLQFKTVTITPEEQNQAMDQERSRSILCAEKNYENLVRSLTPGNLTCDQQIRWDKTVQELQDACACASSSMYTVPYYPNRMVEQLSALHKEITGHVIPKTKRKNINQALVSLRLSRQRRIPAQETVSRINTTDFYKGSWDLDQHFARAEHGRYSNGCELLARAFDCYIADKLETEQSRNRYLNGHSEAFVFRENNGEYICAVPKGAERIRINQKFDEMFQELKELGIFHHRKNLENFSDGKSVDHQINLTKTTLTDVYNTVAIRCSTATQTRHYNSQSNDRKL
ncbi:MAG: hypothetical protein HFG62_07135 [Lachnospiraceae bacterium]|nr:hypothetical protein [Lachnospiraceae bacterium]MCI8958874.1 hypothetical protein [Lachnospiraceae bacterium]